MKYLFAISFMLFAAHARAVDFFKGPQSAAMGHAGRAHLESAESAFLNPALLPLLKNSGNNTYFRDGSLEDGQHRNSLGIGFFDNSEGVWFPGAIHYVRLRDTGRTPKVAQGEVWHVAGGYALNDRVLVGASAYQLSYQTEGVRYSQWNGSLGTVLKISPILGVAYVLDNVAKPGSEIPQGLREDTEQSLGLFGSVYEVVHVRFDISRREHNNPDSKLAYMVGIETLSQEFLLVRAGFKMDELKNENLWTAGLCFNGPRLKIDYAFEKSSDRSSGALHSVDLRLPF